MNVTGVLSGKELCVSNTCFSRAEKRKVALRLRGNVTETDFVLV